MNENQTRKISGGHCQSVCDGFENRIRPIFKGHKMTSYNYVDYYTYHMFFNISNDSMLYAFIRVNKEGITLFPLKKGITVYQK